MIKSMLGKLFKGEKIFWLGMAVVLLSAVPYLILGTGSYVEYFEQLDWGVITYIYQAKYLFSGSSVIPEFLNGASKNALVAPTFGYVLIYRILPPFAAWLFMQISVQIAAYGGMYLLLDKFVQKKPVKMAVSLMFAFLPILAVFGLTIQGVPLAAWAILQLYEKKQQRQAVIVIVIYSLFSSLIYVGFAVLMIWTLLIFFTLVKKQRMGGVALPFLPFDDIDLSVDKSGSGTSVCGNWRDLYLSPGRYEPRCIWFLGVFPGGLFI